jgi:hypothetical protein
VSIIPQTTLLTGLPRSGTTLVCALLNELPDTVALAEPLKFQSRDKDEAISEIDAFVASARQQALSTNTAISKHIGGRVPDNWAPPPDASRRLRPSVVQRGAVSLNKPLSTAFYLIIKEPAGFSVLSDLLVSRYPLIAMVRHPLAVLAAWQTIDIPVNRGRMPIAEKFNLDLKARLDAEPDCLVRQVILLGWLLEIYSAFPPDRILRYEDLISTPRNHLARFTSHARDPDHPLRAVDPSERYTGVELRRLARELMTIRGVAERFYPAFVQSLAPWL